MYDFDDFNRGPEYYENIKPNPDDMSNFASSLMLVTNMFKNLDPEDGVQGGHEVMMKLFNMTGLEGTEDDEDALNVIMCLLSHLVAMLPMLEDKDAYFEYFDQTVIYPLLNHTKG